MPLKGYTAITVPKEFYSDIKRFYVKNRNALRKRGITSFSACIQSLVYEGLKNYAPNIEERRELEHIISELASKIMEKLDKKKKGS